MKKVWIYCGVPGAGKSTLIDRHANPYVCSADAYFTDEFGNYDFIPAELSEAHASCLRQFTDYVRFGAPEIVVDNTNTTVAEIAPYAALALAYGYELEIVTLLVDPSVAGARNIHGVPMAAVQAMHDRLLKRDLPPWWKHTVINHATEA